MIPTEEDIAAMFSFRLMSRAYQLRSTLDRAKDRARIAERNFDDHCSRANLADPVLERALGVRCAS